MVRWAAALLALCATSAASAPPPPPPPGFYDFLPERIDGYDVRLLYRMYFHWVNYRRADVIREVVGQPQERPGLRRERLAFHRFEKYSLGGLELVGEIATWCPHPSSGGYEPNERPGCSYVLQNAFMQPTFLGNNDVIGRFARASFDAQRVVDGLKAAGISPDQLSEFDPVSPANDAFALLPDPLPMLRQHVSARTVSSVDCPAMGRNIRALEGRRISLTIDLQTVGRDTEVTRGFSESDRRDTLTIQTSEGTVELSGNQFAMLRYVGPILDAADACLARRPAQN